MGTLSAWRAAHLAGRLRQGGVMAYPTEGVWGLGCLPESRDAVMRILALKKRSWAEGLILIAGNIDQFDEYLDHLNPEQMETLNDCWPGAITFLVPDNGNAPWWIVGEHDTLALRVTDHPVVRFICDAVDAPLVSTSANISGRPAARSALDVRRYFGERIDVIVPGELGGASGASEIRMLTTGEIVREAA
ncbi:MAG: Sua5/YciO/YrdC/YwlC family protein [Gammaproteobacteria bacterium]|nr:Sua5/YciO/YrdC/YwlC family protein [Gammaproteobacteria bacterium]